MYSFKIKDNSPDINIVVSRCLLALAAVTTLLSTNSRFYFINMIIAVILLVSAALLKVLIGRFKLTTQFFIITAAVLSFLVIRSIPFAALLIFYALIINKLYISPGIMINAEEIIITKMLSKPVYCWNEFNNIILKDNVLTLDFKNNKLLQLNVQESDTKIDENNFNNFCRKFIGV